MEKFKYGDKLVLQAHQHRCRILTYNKHEGKDCDGRSVFSCLEDKGTLHYYSSYMKYDGKTQLIGEDLCSI